MTPELLDHIVTLAVLAAMSAIGAVVPAAKRYLTSATAQNAVAELATSAEIVVRSVEQTLRPAIEDGHLSAEEKAQLKAAAMRALADQLSTTGRKLGQDALDRAIEAAVQKVKQEKQS